MKKSTYANRNHAIGKDPEPITILMLILAALSAAGAWASFGVSEKRMTDEDRAAAQRHIFAVSRALRRLQSVRDELFSILEEYEYLQTVVNIGHAPIITDRIETTEIRRLRREVGQIVDNYSSAIENLVSILGNEAKGEEILGRLEQISEHFSGLVRRIGEDKYIKILQDIGALIDMTCPPVVAPPTELGP